MSSPSLHRRRLLVHLVGVAALGPWCRHLRARPVQTTGAHTQHRLALLVGNGDYPSPHDLPPISKNVMDLGDALLACGFDVTQAMNLDQSNLARVTAEFVDRVRQAPPNAVTLFYYAGHGLQVDANNLLLGSGTSPAAARADLLARSLVLQNKLLAALPARPQALNMTVIDACRTDLRRAFGDRDGLNQVEAPLGSLVCFSTGAGKPAVSPASPDQNTFYTAALVKGLREAQPHTTFQELFRLVKLNVEHTMQNHPLQAIRQLAQQPFIADNAPEPCLVLPPKVGEVQQSAVLISPEEQARWLALQTIGWPVDLLEQSKQFLTQYPASPLRDSVQLLRDGAQQALQVLRSNGVALYKSSFVAPAAHGQPDLLRAARGDKDAAARIARMHKALGTPQGLLRYEGWLQYAAALGNGIASYDLALFYRETAQPLRAAQAEAQAVALGYSPPRGLDHARK
ncbi:caspase family protein [Limnobacter sp.]|uniref:caspase family protein n=1 Tax=Limnobacter sp. TaxID=2003368 RepID=UPI003516DA64